MTFNYEVEILMNGTWSRHVFYVGSYDKESLESAKAAYNNTIRRFPRYQIRMIEEVISKTQIFVYCGLT